MRRGLAAAALAAGTRLSGGTARLQFLQGGHGRLEVRGGRPLPRVEPHEAVAARCGCTRVQRGWKGDSSLDDSRRVHRRREARRAPFVSVKWAPEDPGARWALLLAGVKAPSRKRPSASSLRRGRAETAGE